MKRWFILAILLLVFLGIQFCLPLGDAIQIGADEGYELAKATLSLKGFKMYTEVWNDQPPLHTFLISWILKHATPSVIGPRLLTTGLACVLLGSVFFICRRLAGVWVAGLATGLLLLAPIFFELGASCMVEIPAMAPALMAICVVMGLTRRHEDTKEGAEREGSWLEHRGDLESKVGVARLIFAGVLFGVSFQIKFINVILLPLVGFLLWIQFRGSVSCISKIVKSLAVLGVSIAVTFVAINQLVDGQGFLVQFKQSWEAHFAAAKSLEYGSPADHPFDWTILLKNWDATLPALIGAGLCLRQVRGNRSALFPVSWLVLSLGVFVTHKPWWPCYYLHIAVPLSICAALGIVFCWRILRERRARILWAVFGLYALCAIPWMIGRAYLEIASIRNCPRTYACLFLEDIAHFKPYTKWFYTEEPVYSFHADIPMPPKFAVVALKRLWSGDMTNEKIRSEMWSIKPGIVLLQNENRQVPFADLIAAEYQPVYQDDKHRLYVHKEVMAKAREAEAKAAAQESGQ